MVKKEVAKKQEVKEPKKEAVKKQEVKEPKKEITTKTYHVSQRIETDKAGKKDVKWQVKFANGEKALKLFDTQAEAIAFAKEKAENQDGNIAIHKKDGKLRKIKY